MSVLPKTRFSGLAVTIILLLILVMGIFTIHSRYENERRLISVGFVKLQQYSTQLRSKIDVIYMKPINDDSIEKTKAIKSSNDTMRISTLKVTVKTSIIKDTLKTFSTTNIKKTSAYNSTSETSILKNSLTPVKKKSKTDSKRESSSDNPIHNNWQNRNNYVVEIKPGGKVSVKYDKITVDDSITYGFFDKSFFDGYIVFDDKNEILYNSFKTIVIDSGNYLKFLQTNLYVPANYNIFNVKKDTALISNFQKTGFISKAIFNYDKYYQFVYPYKINKKKLYVCGLIGNKNYLDKKQHVETSLLILIGILLIFTLFSFQFIKLFWLSKSERIKTSDLVLLCFSISGIACFITLLIINIHTRGRLRINTKNQLIELNDSIKANFVKELNLMYDATDSYIKAYLESGLRSKTNILSDLNWQKSNITLWHSLKKYPYFKTLFCSKNGWSDCYVTTWDNESKSRISYRQYYQKNDEWLLPRIADEKHFRLQSIYSNTTGDAVAVLGRPSLIPFDPTVFCVSSPMYSLINTILPHGFEFRIIGQDGLVCFHNDEQKNNNENFLDECDHENEIREAIHNRAEFSLALKISLENYQMHISPIRALPLYLVTLSKTSEQNEFLSHINYILFIFIIIGILFAVVSTTIFYYEKLQTATVNDSNTDSENGLIWLLADKRKNKRYMIIFSLNILLSFIISLPVFFKGCTIYHYLLILFSAYTICFIYSYILLKTFSTIKYKKSIIITFCFFFVVFNIFYYLLSKNFWLCAAEILSLGLILFVICSVFKVRKLTDIKYTKHDSSIKWMNFLGSYNDQFIPYTLFALSWLIFSCVLPTIIIFNLAGRDEVDLIARKNQIGMASKLEQKGIQIDSLYKKHIYPQNIFEKDPYLKKIKDSLKLKGNYLLHTSLKKSDKWNFLNQPVGEAPSELYVAMSKYLRQMITREDIRSYQMLGGTGLDNVWFWKGGYLNKIKSDTLSLFYRAKQKNNKGIYSQSQIRLASFLPHKVDHKVRSIILLVIFFTLEIVFLFLMILIVLKFLFILKRPVISNMIKNPHKIPETGNIFLINSITQEYIKKKSGIKTVLSADQTFNPNLRDVIVPLSPLPETNDKWKLLIVTLDKIVKNSTTHTLVLSSYTPSQIKEIIDEQIQTMLNQNIPDDKKETNQKTISDLKIINQDLTRLFSHFVVCFFQDENAGIELSKTLGIDYKVSGCELVIGNIAGGLTQKSLDIPLKDLYDVFASQYRYLWDSCTTNEKFILSDLSMDSVVNLKNLEDIKNLIGKGILTVNGRLCFKCSSFKRYVKELVGTDEFSVLLKNSRKGDGWNKIKNPLYITFAAVVIFFFFTQHDLINGLNGIIISITGILGTLFKLLSGESSEKEKQ